MALGTCIPSAAGLLPSSSGCLALSTFSDYIYDL